MKKKLKVLFLLSVVTAGGVTLFNDQWVDDLSGYKAGTVKPVSLPSSVPLVDTPLSALSDADLERSGS